MVYCKKICSASKIDYWCGASVKEDGMQIETTVLYRIVASNEEYTRIVDSNYSTFPPLNFTSDNNFVLFLSKEEAVGTARYWNFKGSMLSVMACYVRNDYLNRYNVQFIHRSLKGYCIPAEELVELNRNIINKIEVIAAYPTFEDGDMG